MKKEYIIQLYNVQLMNVKVNEIDRCGTIESTLKVEEKNESDRLYNAAIDGIESLILALACQGVDLNDENIKISIETAVTAISDNYPEEDSQ